ncbi:MAG: complex I NDUFA9 subunit family protein [Chloroflexi bacterium]|nr:complex I NDUFA9 subunit family protein [Chloroflexota bacterium]
MTILVTGANGYVGNNTVRRLVEMGKPVRALVRNMEKTHKRLGDVAEKIEIIQGDVADREGLKRAMNDVSAVIHTVAIALETKGQTYEEVNYQGTINVVDAAEARGVKRFINISQNAASSASPYRFLKSKGRAQEYVASSRMAWTALRPSAIFGPQDEFFNSLARLMQLTPLVFPMIGGGTAQFQPVSVYDVVEASVRALDDNGTISKEFELGGPEVLTLGEIEKRIAAVVGGARLYFPAPTWLLRLPVFIMEKTLPGAPVNGNLLDLLAVPNIVKDNALVSYFQMTPRAFAGENIAYLKNNSISATLRKFFRNATIN